MSDQLLEKISLLPRVLLLKITEYYDLEHVYFFLFIKNSLRIDVLFEVPRQNKSSEIVFSLRKVKVKGTYFNCMFVFDRFFHLLEMQIFAQKHNSATNDLLEMIRIEQDYVISDSSYTNRFVFSSKFQNQCIWRLLISDNIIQLQNKDFDPNHPLTKDRLI